METKVTSQADVFQIQLNFFWKTTDYRLKNKNLWKLFCLCIPNGCLPFGPEG